MVPSWACGPRPAGPGWGPTGQPAASAEGPGAWTCESPAREGAPRPCGALRPETARPRAPAGCGRSAPRPCTPSSALAWPAPGAAAWRGPAGDRTSPGSGPTPGTPGPHHSSAAGKATWRGSSRRPPGDQRGATPQTTDRLSREFEAHREIPDQGLQPGQFVISAIGGPALQARVAAGQELVPPLGDPSGRDTQLAGHQVQILAAQHPQHGLHLLARGAAASLRLRLRHGHLLHEGAVCPKSVSKEIVGRGRVLEPDLKVRMSKMARFRNLLVHLYWKVDDREVWRVIREHLQDFEVY